MTIYKERLLIDRDLVTNNQIDKEVEDFLQRHTGYCATYIAPWVNGYCYWDDLQWKCDIHIAGTELETIKANSVEQLIKLVQEKY